jgi:hypothetical protein
MATIKEQRELANQFKAKMLTDDRWLERGIFAIYLYQTRDERQVQTTKYSNNVGFNGTDGHFMTSLGEWIAHRTNGNKKSTAFGHCLSEKQKAIARRKMLKYAGQLVRISENAQ